MLIEGCQLCKPAICIFASLIGVSFISLRSLRSKYSQTSTPTEFKKSTLMFFNGKRVVLEKKYCKFALVAYQIVVDRNAYALVSVQV